MITTAKEVLMRPKRSDLSAQLPLVEQVIEPAERPFIDVTRALLKAAFLFPNHPLRPNLAYDLTLAQIDVLVALAGTEGGETLSCSEIANRTLITKGGITGILDRLEARGLIKRIQSRDDRRSVMVRLSAKGAELFRKLYPALARSNRYLFERAFTPEQIREFGKLLEILNHSLETR
jgi:MarR family transcriptional regulator, 2-MHQ and catechol-resistance regulon repressor